MGLIPLLTFLLLAQFLCVGCLVGMPIQETVELDNLAPQVVLEEVQPPIDQIVVFRPGLDEELLFKTGPIVEPNPDDRLFYRWFLNYRRGSNDTPIEVSPGSGTFPDDLPPEGIARRIRPCNEPFYSRAATETLHRIELVITDRPFKGVDVNDSRPNQMIGENGTSTRVLWYFRFDRTLCP